MPAGSNDLTDPRLDLGIAHLIEVARRVPPHRLATLIADAADHLGASVARVWLADHQQRSLIHLTHSTALDALAIDGSAAGRAFAKSEVLDMPRDGFGRHVWVPLLDGADRVGVLEFELDTDELTDPLRLALVHLATAATAELISRGQYTDFFTIARRRQSMSLKAELQWQAIPPTSFATPDVTVSGMLEPAYETGGDTFDYAHDQRGLSFAVLDAVGHDLQATMVSTLALGAYRNRRRAGDDLVGMAGAMDEVIKEQLGRGSYATGQLAELDTSSGVLRWLNAGHHLPLLIRGGRVIGALECRPRLPFGLGHLQPGRPTDIAEVQLQPNDAVLLYTDGIVEARRIGGTDFGIERLEQFLENAFAAGYSIPETLRRLSNAVLDYHHGVLQDDATTLLVSWHPERYTGAQATG